MDGMPGSEPPAPDERKPGTVRMLSLAPSPLPYPLPEREGGKACKAATPKWPGPRMMRITHMTWPIVAHCTAKHGGKRLRLATKALV